MGESKQVDPVVWPASFLRQSSQRDRQAGSGLRKTVQPAAFSLPGLWKQVFNVLLSNAALGIRSGHGLTQIC